MRGANTLNSRHLQCSSAEFYFSDSCCAMQKVVCIKDQVQKLFCKRTMLLGEKYMRINDIQPRDC